MWQGLAGGDVALARHFKSTYVVICLFIMLLYGASTTTFAAAIPSNSISLDGDWEFYWNQLVQPGEFAAPGVHLTGYYPVPLYWTKYAGLNLPAKGMATYRLIVTVDNVQQALGIKTPEIYTEYCLWVNGEIIDCHGLGGGSVRYLRPDVYTLPQTGNELEIVLQIRNERHINAGIGQSITIGNADRLHKAMLQSTAIDLVIAAVCLFAGVYHLILYRFKRGDQELLFFGVFCMAVAVRGVMSNQTFVMQLVPDMPFLLGSRILTALIPIITVSVLQYTSHIFVNEVPELFRKTILFISGLYLLLVFFASSYIYSYLFNYYLVSVAVVCVFILCISLRARLGGNSEAGIFFTGALFVAVGAFNDMLFFNQIIHTGYWLAAGLVAFTVAQSIMLAIRFARLDKEKDEIYQRLLTTDMAFMQAQIKPHFIYNALSAISHLTTKEPRQAKELLLDFSDYLRGCFNFDNVNGMSTLEAEMGIVKSYLSIEKARFRERLNVEYEITESPYVLIPMLCIQPLVENAVRHGLMDKIEGGTVRISVWNERGDTHIRIEDDGVGIAPDKLIALLGDSINAGVGLKNVHHRLLAKYGQGLTMLSKHGQGTVVEMIVPQTVREVQEQ